METNKEYSLGKIVKTLFIIIIIILVFYALTILITKVKKNEEEQKVSNVEIQYEEILIGNMYGQKENEYYVLVEKEADYSSLYSPVYNYQQKGDLKLYTATLDNALNKRYLGEESNFEQRFPIFKESTLLKIKDNNIVEHYEGVEAILKIIG